MQIEYVWIALAVVLLAVELVAINSVLRSKGAWDSKGLWLVVIVFVPLIGLLAWALAGPKGVPKGLGTSADSNR